jgi:hypothetical protein
MAIDTATFETTLDSKIDAATTSDDAKSFLLLAKAVEAVNNAISSSSLTKSNNLSDLLNTTTALTNLGFTATIAELNYTDGVTSSIQTQLDAKPNAASPTFTGTPAAPTAATGTNTTQIATTAFVQGEVTALVDSAPSTLNTLNELAAALGDDANFSTTVTNSIATKLPLAGGTMTGAIAMSGANITLGDSSSGSDDRIAFGASAHGQIYHDGTNFLIQETGSGNLLIDGSNITLRSATSENYINCAADGAVTLYHDNSAKIATTSTGVDITGTAVTDGVTVDGTLDIEEVIEKVEPSNSTTGTISFDFLDQAIINFHGNQTANRTINFRGNSSTSLNSMLAVNQSVTCAILMAQGSTAYYLNAYQVDGSSVTPKWSGGSAPSSGNASGIDSYSFTIIKTADATFTVLASQTQYA